MGVDNIGLMIPTLPNKPGQDEASPSQQKVEETSSSAAILYDDLVQYEHDQDAATTLDNAL